MALFRIAPSDGVLMRPPDASTSLVFRTTPDGDGDVLVMGPRAQATYHHANKDVPLALRVGLHPGCARAVLGVGADAMIDRIVPLSELWGDAGRRLVASLRGHRGDPGRIANAMHHALLARVSTLTPRDESQARLVRDAIDELGPLVRRPTPLVREVAQRLNLSERQLRTVFTLAVGVSPKRYARIQRVRVALALQGRFPLARLAVEAGYYDQSHLTSEFRATMGITPHAFISGHLPTPAGC
jgi:AraC-like DNA-binding protein